jgi:uridine phosphorylase
MPEPNPERRVPWAETFRDIADGWLFSDVEGNLPATAIMPLENPDLFDVAAWAKRIDIEQRYRSVTTATYQGRPLGILSARLGAPAAAMTVEAAARRGVRTLIGLGFCGAIADELRCGDLLVPSGAVAADGTSAGYCPERYPAVADREVTSALHRLANNLHDGLVYSVDAVFAQDDALIDRCRNLRVAAIDMETSAVLTVARLQGVRAATILVASDHPGQGLRSDGALLTAGAERAIGLALAAVGDGHAQQLV